MSEVEAVVPDEGEEKQRSWLALASVVGVLLVLAGLVAAYLAFAKSPSPTEVADAFVVAVQQGDAEKATELSESTLIQSPDTIDYLNSLLYSNPGAGYVLESEDGDYALVYHPDSDVDSKIGLVNSDGSWLVSEIHYVASEELEESYDAEPLVVETELLPRGEEKTFPGTTGVRQILLTSYIVNGSVSETSTEELSVLEESDAAFVIKGTGEDKAAGAKTWVEAKDDDLAVQHYRFSSGFTGATQQYHQAGDRFQAYVIMPSGDIVMGEEVVWDGRWDEEDFIMLGAPREKNLAWEWTTGTIASAGYAEAVKDGWMPGGYAFGLTVNGQPLAWVYYYTEE